LTAIETGAGNSAKGAGHYLMRGRPRKRHGHDFSMLPTPLRDRDTEATLGKFERFRLVRVGFIRYHSAAERIRRRGSYAFSCFDGDLRSRSGVPRRSSYDDPSS
jgi:hypothetical protein